MTIPRIFFIFALVFAIETSCEAATWFVRPGVWTKVDSTTGRPIPTAGVYGTQTGTNYANAWNGLTSVIWGGSGVVTGDTLYVCGTHIYKIQFLAGSLSTQALNVIGSSGVTIRMDWPGDAGTLFGGNINTVAAGAPYSGPDANGVYSQVLKSTATKPTLFQINGTNIIRLKARTTPTWTDRLGGQFLWGQTNFIQFPDGSVPTTNNVAQAQSGWAFDLNYKSNITFQSCNFISADPVGSSYGGLRHMIPVSPYTNAANHITFTNCTFSDQQQFYLYPGENDFSFLNCEFRRCSSGPYSLINHTTLAPQRITVSHCYFHDIGTPEYPDGDSHAIGIQGGNNHVISYNTISNTGPAITFWTGNVDMKNSIIAYNFITDTRTNTSAGISDGIAIGGDNSLALYGRRTGNKIYGNVIRNCSIGSGFWYQGVGITVNSPDYTEIYDNTIYGGNFGIDFEVAITNSPPNAKIVNNLIVNPRSYFYYVAGSGTVTNLLVDHNLYYPMTDPTTQTKLYPSVAHDQNSTFSDPIFVSTAPKGMSDFRLSVGSGAIGRGMLMGLTQDILGTIIPTDRAPDIGAFQSLLIRPSPPENLQLLP